jgi:hypothetical protein
VNDTIADFHREISTVLHWCFSCCSKDVIACFAGDAVIIAALGLEIAGPITSPMIIVHKVDDMQLATSLLAQRMKFSGWYFMMSRRRVV